MWVQDVVFWILAVAVIVPALGVVLVKDLFRAVLLLVVVFIAVAGFFVMMSAEFLGVVQVLIYAGAVSILVIFSIMLTRDVQRGNLPNRQTCHRRKLADRGRGYFRRRRNDPHGGGPVVHDQCMEGTVF